jgi:3-oxoacyl-[acyl-carrier-protein] synthase-3
MSGLRLIGMGKALPEQIITNKALEDLVETSDEWILSRTGIAQRRKIGEGTLAELCLQAAKTALARANILPEQIDACIIATITPDSMVPSQACRLQRDLGLRQDIPCFDLSAACTGFLFALRTMEGLLTGKKVRYGLVLGAEALSRITDWTDRNTCILFGDGAGAAVVRFDPGRGQTIMDLGCRGDDTRLYVPGPGTEPVKISMEGRQVFRFAVETVPKSMDRVLQAANLTPADVDMFVFHQANLRIIDLIQRKYHIPPEKCFQNIQRYGNTSAASIPLVLSELAEQGKIAPGARLMLVGFGGGLTWGSALIEFAEGASNEEIK